MYIYLPVLFLITRFYLDGLSDTEIIDKIAVAVKGKKRSLGSDNKGYQLSPEELSKRKNRPMILIGG